MIEDYPFADALKALEDSNVSISFSENEGDVPLIYVNKAFERMTLYRRDDVLGKNCRFLQGEDTNRESVKKLRSAVDTHVAQSVCLLNYRADGEPFHNLVVLTPIVFAGGKQVTLGCQYDLSKTIEYEGLEPHLNGVGGLVNSLQPDRKDAWLSTLETSRLTAESIVLRTRNYLRRNSLLEED